MKTFISILFAGILATRSLAQYDAVSSHVGMQDCVTDSLCVSVTNSGYLFYDESKSALYLKVNFTGGLDTISDWLNELTVHSLYFKVVVPPTFLRISATPIKKNYS